MKKESVPPSMSVLPQSQRSLPPMKGGETIVVGGLFTQVAGPTKFGATMMTTVIPGGNTLFFRDGVRRIDYVLAYVEHSNKATETKRKLTRDEFEAELKAKGIDLEHEPAGGSADARTGFLKLHGTWNFLETQAEAMKVRMPLKVAEINFRSRVTSWLDRFKKYNPCELPEEATEEQQSFTAVYDRRCADQFEIKDQDTFFSSAQRNRMLWDALIRTKYGKDGDFGVKRLIKSEVYNSAYPLHEELDENAEKSSRSKSKRQMLYEMWGRPKRFYKYQPIGLIRNYFGEKIAIYFAWIGFYTNALIPAAIAGLLCFFYGLAGMAYDKPSHDICEGKIRNTTMCPSGTIQDGITWKLEQSCTFAKFTYVFDNIATVLFTLFMSIWSTLFLEGWKRNQAELAWDWDVHDADKEEDEMRPEYVSSVKTMQRNPISGEKEPYLPMTSRVGRMLGSCAVVLLFLFLVIGLVVAMITYRSSMITVFHKQAEHSRANAIVITAVSSAIINLILIMALDYGYQYLAFYLTSYEYPRTEKQFEDSYTFKVFLFEFLNYYSHIIYTAFVKGRWSSVVDADTAWISEPCDPAGCMVELLIQMATIMVGKQFACNIADISWPLFMHRWRRWRAKPGQAKEGAPNSRWEKDYHLNEVPDLFMFPEYLKIVLQYGFLTLFVFAFPLAPLFALVNNVMEIRLDAYKFLGTYRRPMAARARDLGVWNRILDVITQLAIFTNALTIAFTSDFIPRTFYYFTHDRSLANYMEYSLAYYDVRPTCKIKSEGDICTANQTAFCRFKEYRTPPCSLNDTLPPSALSNCDPDGNYYFSGDWWKIFVARLAFVLIFEHVVFLIKSVIIWLNPATPEYVLVQMQREKFLAKQALYNRAGVNAGKNDADETAGVAAGPKSNLIDNNAKEENLKKRKGKKA